MDIREILIANTKTQKRYKVNTDATTLGELKAALDAEGIDYAGMTFTEGISKTQLLSDDAQLPTNVMYKGEPTNNLVMLLTNTTKNISSGAMTRKEVYSIIRENELQDDLKGAFGNWTIVSTEALEDFIRNNYDILDENPEVDNDEEEDEEEEEIEATNPEMVSCLFDHIMDMYHCDVIDDADIAVLANELADFVKDKIDVEPEAPRHPAEITDEETNDKIDDILEGM